MTFIDRVIAMLKKASLVGAFLLLLTSYGYAATALCSIDTVPAAQPVSKVVDGDTLRLADGRRVRLIGINAPELGGRGQPTEAYAVKATRRLTALVKASNNRVHLRIGEPSHDRYGRVLAHVYDANGVSLEAQLVAEGLAYHTVVAPNTALAQCLSQAEQQARIQRLGLWRNATFTRAEKINAAGFTLLQGRIERVQRNRGGIWLELGHSVTVNIPLNALPNFTGQRFEQWQGRTLKIRGWLSERKGQQKKYAKWRLTVSHPSMLELQ